MSDAPEAIAFGLSPRQKRLRTITLIIIGFILVMLAISVFHPFFHPVRPPHMTERVRKALAAQGLMILGYYTVIFALAISLVLMAWLYVREVRLQLLMAQRDIWKEIVDRKEAERVQKRKKKRNGAEE